MVSRSKRIGVLLISAAAMVSGGRLLLRASQHPNISGSSTIPKSGEATPARKIEKGVPKTQALEPDDLRIVPGSRVGLLHIGDSKETALRLFVFKPGSDKLYEDECGGGYDWVSLDRAGISRGQVTIHFRDDVVTQIESASPFYRTADDTRIHDPPEKVRSHWPGFKAYALLPGSPDALGGLPLIFWLNQRKGFAFEFAFDQERQRRYLYSMIVFSPGAHLCPEGEGERLGPETWRPLAPYATQVDDRR